MSKKKSGRQPDDMPADLVNVGCQIYSLAECEQGDLKPFVIYKDRALVADPEKLMTGKAGWNKMITELRLRAYSYLSGQVNQNGGVRNALMNQTALRFSI